MNPLGKLPAVKDPRTLDFASYSAKVPAPPKETHRSHPEFGWPVFLNDQLGDCTIAAGAHMQQGWALEVQPASAEPAIRAEITDAEVLVAYEACSGYDPVTGANDNGCVELDVLKYWRSTGIGGRRIAAFASINPQSATLIKQAVYLFGGAYIGLALPMSARSQTGGGKVWDVPAGGPKGYGSPGSWGGHAVPIVSYDAQRLAVITWGTVQLMTWRFLGTYCDEAYAVLSPDMLKAGKSPQGLDVAQLTTDLAAL